MGVVVFFFPQLGRPQLGISKGRQREAGAGCVGFCPPGAMLQAVAIYGTSKEVKLLDRRLGMLHLFILTLVLGYVIGIRVIVEKGYQSLELSQGTVAVTLVGGTFTKSNNVYSPADEADLVDRSECKGSHGNDNDQLADDDHAPPGEMVSKCGASQRAEEPTHAERGTE